MTCDDCDRQAICDAYQRGQREMRAHAVTAALESLRPARNADHKTRATAWKRAGDVERAILSLEIICECHK